MDAATLSTLCGVSRSTAYRWLKQPEKMPPSARHLVALVSSGRILPPSWRGWRFDGDRLISDIGDAMQPAQVSQWSLYCSWWRQACRENHHLREYVDYLESLLPRADVVNFPRGRSRPSATEGKSLNPLFDKE